MGASLDTPARCPLCQELTRDPVTLKCGHRFCRRCIGDLWSAAPRGPFRCPEWRCPTEYRTLPFDRSLIRTPPPGPGPGAGPGPGPGPNAAAASSSEQSLRRPSLAGRLLGKRKAGAPAAEQPDTKRPAAAPPPPTPTPPSPPPPPPPPPVAAVSEKPGRPAGDDAASCDPPVVTLDESDSSDEVDICDAAPPPAAGSSDAEAAGGGGGGGGATPPPNQYTGSSTSTSTSPARPIKPPLVLSHHPAAAPSPPMPQSHAGPVLCHCCPEAGRQPAAKTCLVCGASMCAEHLRPHLDSPVFQSHALVPPVEDISAWRCQEHQEINRIYCRQCGVCVCTVCTVIGSHRDHACVSIREAERELRGNLKEEIRQLQSAEQQVKSSVSRLTEASDSCRVALAEAREGVRQQYGAIREALEQEEQSALQCVAKEEARVLGALEERLIHLRSSLLSIQHGLHSLEGLADAKGDRRVQDQVFIMEYSKIAQLAGSVASSVEPLDAPQELDRARLRCLQRWTERRLDAVIIAVPGRDADLYKLLYGTVPVLDADTAHAKLQLSDGDRRATYSDAPQLYPEHQARFSSFPQVLGRGALQGGRWYWEVDVSPDEGRWKVGLCEAQMERKGQRDGARLGFNSRSWCLACDRRRLEALHDKEAVPVDASSLQRVGVFLDCDEGVLSFFNVAPGGSLTLMHSFRHSFTQPLHPALSVSKTQLVVCDLFQP